MNHDEDRAIDLHLLSNDPERFFEMYAANIEAQIRCRLLYVGLTQYTDNSVAQLIKGLKNVVKSRLQKKCSLSTQEIVARKLNKLLNNNAFLLENSIPLLITKYRADILKLIECYCRDKFVTSSNNLRRHMYHALHTELMALRHQIEPLCASIGMILKATASDLLDRVSNEEDIELLQSCDNKLATKYKPVIHIKTQRMINGTPTLKEDIESDVTLILLEKIRKGSLEKNYKNDGTVYAYLNTIIYRDIYTALNRHRPKIETVSVSNSHILTSADSRIHRFESDDELSHYLRSHAKTLDATLSIVCKSEEATRRFKLILAMLYNTESIHPQHIKSLYPRCKRETIDEIIQFAGQNDHNRQDFFEFMNGILSRIERRQTQKSDSFRKNYERKEDKIWDDFFRRHNINFSRRGNENIEYFTELVQHYFEYYSNSNKNESYRKIFL